MDPITFSRKRLFLACESRLIPSSLRLLSLRSGKNPVPTLPEPDRDSCIPAGLPQSIVSPTAWTGADFENGEGRQRYSIALDDAQIREIEEACEKFKGPLIPKLRLNSASLFLMMSDCRVCCVQLLICCETELDLPLECISQESFLLPTLGNKLKALAAELTSGVGFFLIRGLDPQRYSNLTNVVLYLGISSYIGGKRGRQDELGNMLRASLTENDVPRVAVAERIWQLTHKMQSI